MEIGMSGKIGPIRIMAAEDGYGEPFMVK